MKYNTSCSRCGKLVHHKQIIWKADLPLATQCALLGLPISIYKVRLCYECVKIAMQFLVDNLEGHNYKYFLTHYGEHTLSNFIKDIK